MLKTDLGAEFDLVFGLCGIYGNDAAKKARESKEFLDVQWALYVNHQTRLKRVQALSLAALSNTSGLNLGQYDEKFVLAVKNNNFAKKLPYLFQLFIEVFGGWLVKDNDKDLEILAALSNIPKDEILPCLSLYDNLKPIGSSSSFYDHRGKMTMLKHIPAYLRGVGCFSRRIFYDSIESTGISNFHTSRYHNVLVDVLSLDDVLKVA